MRMQSIFAALAATVLVASSATRADAKRAKHHHLKNSAKNSIKSARVHPNAIAGFRQEPARMIEVKPGLWISSYGCVTDDGYGRYLPCDVTDSSR